MARPLRIEFSGALYHVTARGNERKALFYGDADRELFKKKLAESVQRYHVRLYAYTLMENHYHLIVETPRANLSRFMQHLNGSYTTYFNRRHHRHGHLFEGRFKARLVEGTRYLLTLTRYVHLNPVKIKKLRCWPLEEKVKYLRGYKWGSYRAYAGLAEREEFVDYGPLGNLVGEGKRDKERAYRSFVESGIARNDEELQAAMSLSSKAIGGMEFCRQVEEQHGERLQRVGAPSQVAMRRVEAGPDAEQLLEEVARECAVDVEKLVSMRKRTTARLLAMKLLVEQAGWTETQVAKRFGLRDGSSVCHYLKNCAPRSKQARQIQGLEKSIAHRLHGF